LNHSYFSPRLLDCWNKGGHLSRLSGDSRHGGSADIQADFFPGRDLVPHRRKAFLNKMGLQPASAV
jgi:hypothetical protein